MPAPGNSSEPSATATAPLSERGIDLAVGATLTAVAGSIFVSTACPTVFWYDSAEMATAAATLGIPHPPGYPLYTIVAWLFTWLPVEPAYAVNLMSAVFGALCVGLFYGMTRALDLGRIAAGVGAMTLALSPLIWSNSTVAEVYMPGLATLIGVFWLLIRATLDGRPRLTILAALIAGLGLGFHMSIVVCGLGLAWLAWLPSSAPGTFERLSEFWAPDHLRPRLTRLLPLLGATVLGACIFLWLPIRSAMNPAFMFKVIDSPREFFYMVTSKDYQQFFKDGVEMADTASYLGTQLVANLTWAGLALATLGLITAARRAPHILVVWLLSVVANFAVFYNYGVHDLEVFFIPSYLMSVWALAYGLDTAVQLVRRAAPERPATVIGLGIVASLLPLFLLGTHFGEQDRAEQVEAKLWGEAFMAQLPENSLLISFESRPEWHLASVIRYYRKAIGMRPDVEEWNRATPDRVVEQLRAGRPIFTFIGHGLPRRRFRLQQEGLLWRVVGLEMGALEPPRR